MSGKPIFGLFIFPFFGPLFFDVRSYYGIFGLRDPSGWLRRQILLQNGGLGPQINGIRPQKKALGPLGTMDLGPLIVP